MKPTLRRAPGSLWCAGGALTVLLAHPLHAQSPRAVVEVSVNIRVSPATLDRPLTEPYLVAHPTNPKHLIATAILAATTDTASRTDQPCVALISADGGVSWSVPHRFPIGSCADPWLALRDDGVAVFTALDDGDIRAFRSEDQGRTWSPVALPEGFSAAHDRPMVEVDPTSGSFYLISIQAGRSATRQSIVYIHLSASTDGGRTFAPPVRVLPSNLNLNVFSANVLAASAVAVSFADFQSNVDDFRNKGRLERRRTWLLVSSDRGRTFGPPLFVAEQLAGPIRVDHSAGPFRNRLYMASTTAGDDIRLIHSSDAGERWSEPVRVNSTAGGRPHTVSIAVNNNGTLGVAWYERDAERPCQRVYFTASSDGGQTFATAIGVSTADSCPETAKNGRAAERWPYGGDYSGLAASADGTFHVLWADSRDGLYRLYTAQVKVGAR